MSHSPDDRSAVVVRPVAPARDGAALAGIYAPHVVDSAVSFEYMAPDAAEMARRATALVDGGGIWLVAEQAGACIGYAYAGGFRTRAAYDATVETSAYIAETARAGGIGRRLYMALFAALAARQKRQAIAVITLPNAASVAFHERLGFHLAGRLTAVGWKFDRAWDVGLYQRAITADDTAPPAV